MARKRHVADDFRRPAVVAAPSPWGAQCASCNHVQLIHQGERHTGRCMSLGCVIDFVRGWSTASRCTEFVGPRIDEDPPIPDDPTVPAEATRP